MYDQACNKGHKGHIYSLVRLHRSREQSAMYSRSREAAAAVVNNSSLALPREAFSVAAATHVV